jgi:hypothetical protein
MGRSTVHRLQDGFEALRSLEKVIRVRYQLDALGLA